MASTKSLLVQESIILVQCSESWSGGKRLAMCNLAGMDVSQQNRRDHSRKNVASVGGGGECTNVG